MVAEKTEPINKPWPEFRNQDESFQWPAIGKRACGPTVIAMAMNLLRKDHPYIPAIEPEDLLFELGSMNKLPISNEPHYYLVVEHTKTKPKRYVAIGNRISDNLREEITNDARLSIATISNPPTSELNVYEPVFTLEGGIDHRGTKYALANYDVTAKKFGDPKDKKTIASITAEIKLGNMLICSVDYEQDSTHVILVTKYDERNDVFLVYDPKAHEPQWLSGKELESKFRGYGTIIYPEGENYESR